MSRHRRLQKTLRSQQRYARRGRNRSGREIARLVRDHFADGHVHFGKSCPRDEAR